MRLMSDPSMPQTTASMINGVTRPTSRRSWFSRLFKRDRPLTRADGVDTMRRFVYVQALADASGDLSDPEQLSFRHWMIDARNEEDAYTLGARFFDGTSDEVINDYVIALEG